MKKWILPLLFCAACNTAAPEQKNIDENNIVRPPQTEDSSSADEMTSTSIIDEIGSLPAKLQQFVPDGFSALDTTSGDLDLDGHPDMILVLKTNTEDTSSSTNGEDKELKRPMLLLLAQPDGNYKLAVRNDNAVLCHNCGGVFGDPFTGISISNGYFSVEHAIAGGNHWESVTTFKYDKEKKNWFQHRYGYISYKMNTKEGPDEDALVKDVEVQKTVKDFGNVLFEKYDAYKD